jgi:hypothetical protein
MKLFKRGTASILFGVHQFVWHPFTVWRAWRYLYKRNPTAYELIAIICHDLGYWGKPDMDGPEGQTHPEGGAKIAMYLAYWLARLRGRKYEDAVLIGLIIYKLSLFHSTHYSQAKGAKVSSLYLPDKVCVLFDPSWFYLLRARLSGELQEYVSNANQRKEAEISFNQPEVWFAWYRQRMHRKAAEYRFAVEAKREREEYLVSHGLCECEICTKE